MSQAGKPQPGDKIGYTVLYPLRFVGGDFEAGTGFEAVKSSAQIIVGADAASENGNARGEFPANRRIGTHLRAYLHKNIRGVYETVLRTAGMEGITQLDPRIILDPAKFRVGSVADNQVRIGIGLQLDPAFTGETRSGDVETVVK